MVNVAKTLAGTYALVVTTTKEEGTIVAGRLMSPLVLGVGDNEVFLASDSAAILEHTKKMIFLENGDFVEIKNGKYKLFDSELNEIQREIQEIDWEVSEAEKSGYDHFMYKEILEQSEVIERTLSGRLEASSDEIPIKLNEASKFEKIWIVACGTAYHAGLFGKDLFEKVLGVPVSVELASEFRYREPIVGKNDLGIVISQSGETMDTIAATELLKENGSHVLALVNVVGSSLARMADSVFYLHVGQEIGVTSTKAYLGMLVSQLVIAKHWDAENKLDVSFDEIAELPKLIDKTMACEGQIKDISEKLLNKDIKVKFAIHPVAGRLPGHMNVLLAEANLPYDIVFEMDEINSEFKDTDVVMVVGANDIVNPGAMNDESSPIFGMPVLEVWESKKVIVLKRTMAAGYSGVSNPLYIHENTFMLFGDAKESLNKIDSQLS